jgi:rhodanese-related sulfurtransferase
VIDRNVLRLRLDPSSPDRPPFADDRDPDRDRDRRIVIVCNEGYSPSLAAHALQRLGLANATDLCGGSPAWAGTADGERPPI